MKKQYFYIGKKESLKHQSMVYAVSEEPIPDYKKVLGDNAIEYYGDNLPFYLTVVDDNTVRESTNYELYLIGVYELADGEFVLNEEILNVNDFSIPEGTVKPVFDYEALEWVETATIEEIEEHEFNESVVFYNSELEFANKATTEFVCEIINQETFESVKVYMKAIDPYGQPTRTFSAPVRPSIFDKYTK